MITVTVCFDVFIQNCSTDYEYSLLYLRIALRATHRKHFRRHRARSSSLRSTREQPLNREREGEERLLREEFRKV